MIYNILYLAIYFVFKKSLSICHIMHGHFSRWPLICSIISETRNIVRNILGSTYWLQSMRKNDTKNFFYLFICKVNRIKVNSVVKPKNVLFANEPFFAKCKYRFFALISLHTLKKAGGKILQGPGNGTWSAYPSPPKIRFLENQI